MSRNPAAVPDEVRAPELDDEGAAIVAEELSILERIGERIKREAERGHTAIENLGAQMIEVRDMIAEAKAEDLASLVDQMHQLAALSRKRGSGRSLPVDPANPYFGHLRLREARRGTERDVLIGKRTLLDDGDGLAIVDWRNAPISRLYYRYEEGEEYEEEFDERSLEGRVMLRRSLAVAAGELRRVGSPQGTFVLTRSGRWRAAVGAADQPVLEGGTGAAIRVERGQLGIVDEADEDAPRSDKRLQEITALIDKHQFGLITRPDSGIVLIQGGAGSGKTTVALHRVAYLAFQDPDRFRPQRMAIIVFNEALVEYIKHVLPSLGVEGVTVTTVRRWSAALLRRVLPKLPARRNDGTPDAVVRFKKHRVMLEAIDRHVAAQLEEVEQRLEAKLGKRSGGEAVLGKWKVSSNLPPVVRVERLIAWLRDERGIPPRTRAAGETVARAAQEEMKDVVAAWSELLSDTEIMEWALDRAGDEFSEVERRSILKWCGFRSNAVAEWVGRDEDDERLDDEDDEPRAPAPPPLPDGEDDAILLRMVQGKFGGLFSGKRRVDYEHVVIDEAQDLCPIEVRVILDAVSPGKSVTIAGDKAQKMIFDNGFTDWPSLLRDAGLPHVAIQPLKITYRSTRQVMDLAHAVLGPLHDDDEGVVARDGAPVSYYSFTDMGESVAFLAEALRSLMRREPAAAVALVTRFPQQAQAYYDGLRLAEVPGVRLVQRQNFTFAPGIDVTDVRHVKGLEFDYVIVLDPTAQNYPVTTAARHLLHIACTRTAHQLWLVSSGQASALLPETLVNSGEMAED